jgi:hypothetical protein
MLEIIFFSINNTFRDINAETATKGLRRPSGYASFFPSHKKLDMNRLTDMKDLLRMR